MNIDRKPVLLQRLDAIGQALADSGKGLALLGLGSVGVELDRLDEFSDLDFFAIVRPGYKQHFIQDLGWLSDICPLAYCFQNTPDGYKLLFQDGIFCEFAVFEPNELANASFSEGRIVWKAEGVDEDIRLPRKQSAPPETRSTEWMVGEALTCLYVGLCRYHRGEKLSAQRFIQHYAVDRIVELSPLIEPESQGAKDIFSLERRYEQRFPEMAQHLAQFVQGYDYTRESARAILDFLDQHFKVNLAMKEKIAKMLDLDKTTASG